MLSVETTCRTSRKFGVCALRHYAVRRIESDLDGGVWGEGPECIDQKRLQGRGQNHNVYTYRNAPVTMSASIRSRMPP